MKVLLAEYACGGAADERSTPTSLFIEGRAMSAAVASDLLALPEITLNVLWSQNAPRLPILEAAHCKVHQVASPDEFQSVLQEQLSDAQRVLLIAPESDGILAAMCELVESTDCRSLNCTAQAIRECGDKLTFSQRCSAAGIPCLPTAPLTEAQDWESVVIKLREGAGSTEMSCVSFGDQLAYRQSQPDAHRFIAQPYCPGRPISVAALFDHGTLNGLWPLADQVISVDGTFRYQGGMIPAVGVRSPQVKEIVLAVGEMVPGLHGYVGFDLLLRDGQPHPVLMEVNPRLTTSYVGYRHVARESLGPWLVDPGRSPRPTFQGGVHFRCDGTILESLP